LNNILDKDAFVTGANGELGLKDDRYSLFDMSYAKNSDGYFSAYFYRRSYATIFKADCI
jgi:hypothetical protein